MKATKFILSSVVLTSILILCVVIVNFFVTMYQDSEPVSFGSDAYSIKEIIVGILNEGLRAVLLCYLFPYIKGAGSSYLHAIKFNLVIAGLIGSLWIIAGYGMFVLKNPGLFLVEDTIILLLQGVASGVCLQMLYKKKFIPNLE